MAGTIKRRDVFADEDISFMDISPDDAYMSSEADMSDNSSTYSFMAMGEDDNRVESPKTILDVPRIFTGRHHAASGGNKQDKSVDDDENGEKRVTIWNWREKRKLSGNSAPFKKNLHEYLRKHPDWEEYRGQDKDMNGKKLSPKKRREQQSSTPSTPAPTPTKTPMPEPDASGPQVEMHEQVPIYLHSAEDLAKQRSAEMAARRKSIEEEEAHQRRAEQEAESKRVAEAMEIVRRNEAQRAAAWKAAQEEAQRIQAERATYQQEAEKYERKKRQAEDEQNQQLVIGQSVSRLSTWKRVRLNFVQPCC